jgi:hypothetical protein
VTSRCGLGRLRRRMARAAGPAWAATAGAAILASACGVASPPRAAPYAQSGAPARLVAPLHLSAAEIGRLPLATTFGSLSAAPQDPDPFAPEKGLVLHPTAIRVIYARPGGPPVARLPVSELAGPTWVPVVASQPGWDRVLLPTRPNRSTGWIYLLGGGLQIASDGYRIAVDVADDRLTVTDSGRSLGAWPVAVGAAATPTPTGRTFLLASMAPVHPTYSPLILALGLHSSMLGSFGGGPGTVGMHGWPDPAVFGHPVSHGCIRVPADALRVLARIPIGSSVMIVSKPGERTGS